MSSHAAVLRLERLCVCYADRPANACVVQDLSLSVESGECLGVVGESGAGKSQAFLAAMGLSPRAAQLRGSIRLGHTELLGLPRRLWPTVRGPRMSMVFQDPGAALTPHLRIGEQIAESLVAHRGADWRTARERALELLERLQVSEPAQRLQQYPHELSGGMRQRVLIACALACDPQLLIADEPTTALDVTVQAQILALLAKEQRDRGMSLVLITHDLGVIAGLADRVAVMQCGRLAELAPVRRLFGSPQHPHTRALLAASRHADASGGVGLSAGAPLSAPTAPGATAATAPPSPALLEVRSLRVEYRAALRRSVSTALTAICLSLSAGESVGVVGESGSGKSTLLRTVLQLVRPVAGEILWSGRALAALRRGALRAARSELQAVFQDPAGSLDPRMTAHELVAEPLELHRPELSPHERDAAVTAMLARVGLEADHAARFAHELSGGQCQRVAIARAMILAPRLLLCDEPLSALDLTTSEQILELLRDLRSQSGTALLLVSHDLSVVRRLCERVLVLYRGRMMEQAPADTLLVHPVHPYTRTLLAAVPLADPERQRARLASIPLGEPPASAPAGGCVFRARCAHARPVCGEREPTWQEIRPQHFVACHRWPELVGAPGAHPQP